MSKKGGSQTTTSSNTIDPEFLRKAYEAAGKVGTGSETGDARNFFTGAVGAGNLGFGALSGDPASVDKMMNPYMGNVIDRAKSNFSDLNAMTTKGINDQATLGGAFGGSRHGVAEGVALSQNAKGAQDQISNLLYGGYNDAMGRAGQMANFGFGAAGMLPGLDPSTMGFNAMSGLPYNSTQTVTQPTNRNAGSGVAGGAIAGGSIGSKFGPWGAGIGAGLGGLLGLFG